MTGVVNAVFGFSDPFAVDVVHHSNCWRDNIVADYGYPAADIKFSYVKEILMNGYRSDIGFSLGKKRKNKSGMGV